MATHLAGQTLRQRIFDQCYEGVPSAKHLLPLSLLLLMLMSMPLSALPLALPPPAQGEGSDALRCFIVS